MRHRLLRIRLTDPLLDFTQEEKTFYRILDRRVIRKVLDSLHKSLFICHVYTIPSRGNEINRAVCIPLWVLQ